MNCIVLLVCDISESFKGPPSSNSSKHNRILVRVLSSIKRPYSIFLTFWLGSRSRARESERGSGRRGEWGTKREDVLGRKLPPHRGERRESTKAEGRSQLVALMLLESITLFLLHISLFLFDQTFSRIKASPLAGIELSNLSYLCLGPRASPLHLGNILISRAIGLTKRLKHVVLLVSYGHEAEAFGSKHNSKKPD